MVLHAMMLLLLTRAISTEEIKKLPGTEELEINFKHYSGYFQVSDTHYLHYWFVESQNNVTTNPLIFWFNGGPGCSSLDGLLNEMGPYVVNDDGKTLRENPYSWNKLASIVYIESPAGVGYSYSSNGNLVTDDDKTAEENYVALKKFFETFPDFRNHSVFIMGESYGGIYVPTLTALVIKGKKEFPINLKGIALGNGYVDEALNIDTSVLYAYSHGLIDEKTWKSLEKDCCKGCINTCQLINITERRCMSKIRNILRFIWSGRINPYDLYRDCKPSSKLDRARIRVMKFGLTGSHPSSMKSDKLIKNQKAPETILDYLSEIAPLAAEVPCINDSALNQYMNSEDVRRALHIRENASRWEVCNDKIITVYEKIRNNMAPYIKAIVKEGVQVLLYYGDTDMACNFIMGQRFSASLKLPRKKTKQPWVFDSQIAGFVTVYKGLIFATVRGAGHMAPQWRAPQMQYLINEFINDGYF